MSDVRFFVCCVPLILTVLICTLGLSFSITQSAQFKQMIAKARTVRSGFVPPTRNALSGRLLEMSYKKTLDECMAKLMKDADIYGISLFGDGATVRKMPLFNVLGSGINEPAAVLDIVDCSDHLSAGGKKDSVYIASLFQDYIPELDPNGSRLDLILMDGAGNVQKGARLIEAKYPRVSVIHGVEHVVSLFFSDVAKLRQVDAFIRLYRDVYRVFGSGSMHSPYAIFQKVCCCCCGSC